ncbi:FAD-dependent monooxygenase [Leptolyngbya sp. FACHB-261]|uniref:FAD-dependent monooxygenase n=1 Tax=Leptolyngbya sp. FACHB-261 TaxID=2692806 RepID=UPI001687C760|nr:FAD-dependent monooxygenase [Leptolyngbya sp. FACHB-261]MBD2101378.1 FAD-dependent monooxygenase [Leptolyngbya sp. FACHB-261]
MSRKIIVIGGGIGGLTLARVCLDASIPVEVYEKRTLPEMLSGPGGIFIQRNAMRVYQLLWDGQLYDRFYQHGGTIREGGFFNKNGELLYLNSPKFVQADNLGICLLRPELQQILYDALPEGTVKTGCVFENFEESQDTVRVFFQNGSIAEGSVLVGADGLYSSVRAQLQEKEQLERPIYSGTCCWRGYFEAAGLPLDERYSWSEYWGQGDRFGYFDVGSGRFSFYAFVNTPAGGTDELAGGALNALRSRFSSYANPVPAILDALSAQPIYRDDIYDREPLGQTWGRGRVTLIGDAAHPVQPNLGQGGCMAIEDAFELVKQLIVSHEAETVPSLLRQFEASRCDRINRVFTTSRQVGQLGQAENAIACFIRNWIYKLTPTWLADQQFKWLFDYVPRWTKVS